MIVRLTTIGITRMKRPIKPGSRAKGKKAAIEVNEAANIGTATSLVPSIAAVVRGSPLSSLR